MCCVEIEIIIFRERRYRTKQIKQIGLLYFLTLASFLVGIAFRFEPSEGNWRQPWVERANAKDGL